MFGLDEFLAGLELTRTDEDCFRVPTMNYYGSSSSSAASSAVSDVIAGGQLLSQALQVAHEVQPDKTARTLHAVFARTGRVSQPLEAAVQTLNDGRSTGTLVITFTQQDRPVATATVMTHSPDEDVIRHGSSMPDVPRPGHAEVQQVEGPLCDSAVVLHQQLSGPDDLATAELATWVRCSKLSSDQHLQQALVAFVSNFPLVGVAMRPHPGLSVDMSHLKVSTGVLAHTMSFHDDLNLSEWTLINYDAPNAGRGRYFGHGEVFSATGEHVASFVQDGMIRGLPDASGPSGSRL
jgi:acyl-CoA thioesterase II